VENEEKNLLFFAVLGGRPDFQGLSVEMGGG
jgi:hypothetical protein